jgi:antitoxin component YwqK of YwqJK toxin-antitoxin module
MTKRKPLLLAMLAFLFVSCDNKNVKIEKYDNGLLKSASPYKNGLENGEVLWFYDNGYLEQKINFVDGKANGRAYYFYKSGAMSMQRFWINDKMEGYGTDYFEDTIGLIKNILFYRDNKPTYRKEFDQSGNLLREEGVKPILK